jgi:hypothetical protein
MRICAGTFSNIRLLPTIEMPFYRPALFPPGDKQRVEFLRSLNILDTPADISFDRITEAASTIMHSPIACISLIDSDRQWIKSKVGMDVNETSRDLSFCSHVIAQSGDEMFVVCDAREDERFKYHDLVMGEPNICFYAAIPLVIDSGNGYKYKIGTLCIVDFKPRMLEAHHQVVMETLAQLVVKEIDKLRGLHSTHDTHCMQEAMYKANHSHNDNQSSRMQEAMYKANHYHNDNQPSRPALHCSGESPSLEDIEASWRVILAAQGISPFPPSHIDPAARPKSFSSVVSASRSSNDWDADQDHWRSTDEEDYDSDLASSCWWSDRTSLSPHMDFN